MQATISVWLALTRGFKKRNLSFRLVYRQIDMGPRRQTCKPDIVLSFLGKCIGVFATDTRTLGIGSGEYLREYYLKSDVQLIQEWRK